jgi:hypothetical protein
MAVDLRMDTATWQVLVLMIVFSGLVLWKIASARKSKDLYIRRIAGLNAIDEAIGRATELGAPILFHPGIDKFSNIQTLAAMGILDHVARTCAKFGTRIIITTGQPVMVPICESVLKAAFEGAGRPELMSECEVRFISPANDLTALGTAKVMVDEKVATCFLFGSYDYTSLLYSEGGQMAGCMQIAGTADYYQIPFFIASCDYVVIVEELFACSSYLNREPTMLGSVVGIDYGKLVLLMLILIGIVSVTLYGAGNPLNGFERIMTF